MAYFLLLLGALGALVWFTPARNGVGQAIMSGARALGAAASSPSDPWQDKVTELRTKARAKALEILRGQIHEAVDDMVK
jgi:hypothetical protein